MTDEAWLSYNMIFWKFTVKKRCCCYMFHFTRGYILAVFFGNASLDWWPAEVKTVGQKKKQNQSLEETAT